MKLFLKLNALSMLFAFVFFIGIQLIGNVYRLSRITGIGLDRMNISILIVDAGIVVLCTIAFHLILKHKLTSRKANYWCTLLWLPYFFMFTFLFVSLFPITNPGEQLPPAAGLMIIAGVLIFPLYLTLVIWWAHSD
ncbi:hypothetical protein Q7A53_11315 [Halobacillus rhizosphaerae]|uniref:hypothetical protein n=1 Tax=Halobacillus rhizosphaerae TaxID=3064889 RepID=UPI00398A8FFB